MTYGCGDSIWQNRPPDIFADLPEDGLHPYVDHILYTQTRACDGSMSEGAPDATSVHVHQDLEEHLYNCKPFSPAIDLLRAPGVTFEDIDQHRVIVVASVSFNADFTKLIPSQDVVFCNDHS